MGIFTEPENRYDVIVNKKNFRRYFFISLSAISFIFNANNVFGQVVRAGIKGGFQVSWVSFDDHGQKDRVNIYPMPGYNVGGVVAFKVKDRYFLHTEYLYSTRGKVTTSDKKTLSSGLYDPNLKDRAMYRYLELPVMFTMHFKGKIGKTREFKWYLGAGPDASYWLGGKGTMVSGDITESPYAPRLDYKIHFGERGDNNPRNIYLSGVNRWQLGLNIGVGLMLEPVANHKIMLDLRYGYSSTRLGKKNSYSDHILPSPFLYQDDLKARNQGLRFSLMYLLEYNTSKKVRNKGKSTIKIKR